MPTHRRAQLPKFKFLYKFIKNILSNFKIAKLFFKGKEGKFKFIEIKTLFTRKK